MDSEISLLVDNLDRAFDRRSWHGTNAKGALRGLGPESADRHPGKDGVARLKADLALLSRIHKQLRETVAAHDPEDLDCGAGPWTWRETILGAAAHDLHHAGQMLLIRRMGEK